MPRGLEFYQWQDMYHMKKKQDKSLRREGPKEIYNRLRAFFYHHKDHMSVVSCDAEEEWFLLGNPYYKIWPNMAEAMQNLSIDIEGRFLHLPFPTYEIRLPKNPPIREREDTPALKSLLVYRSNPPRVDAQKADNRDWTLIVHYQLDLPTEDEAMGWYFCFGIADHESIADRFESAWHNSKNYPEGYVPSREFAQGLVKMAIATAFFGVHNHELVMPDIPNRFIDRWHAAQRNKDESEAKKLLDKAKRLGHFGWNVRSEIDLPRPIVTHHQKGKEGTGRELQFGHIRSGHMRMQPYGPKDNPTHYELIFVAPTIVREDLPLKTVKGFRLRDEVLQRRPQT